MSRHFLCLLLLAGSTVHAATPRILPDVEFNASIDKKNVQVRADGKPLVDEIATLLKNDATLKLVIEGHTDNSGIAAHNIDLSRQRADSVVRQLVASGIDAGRLQAAGKGAAAPLADNKDEAGRAQNRRVELVKI